MRSTYIILRSGISGGSGTLSIRIGAWLIDNGDEVIYICQEFNDMNNVESMKKKGIKVHCWQLNEVYSNLIQTYGRERKLCFLTYSLNEFIFVEKLKKKLPITKSILYVLRKYGLIRGESRTPVINKLLNVIYKRLIGKLNNNNNIIYIDERTIETTEQYYNLKIENREEKIYKLPMYVNDFNAKKIEKKCDFKYFNLLTILRADFPFKGYVIGLLKDYEVLYKKYKNVKLTIIAFGQGDGMLKKYIEKLTTDARKNIDLIGQTPYEKLKLYFDKAKLYIGMGTTVLDAVNHGVPAVVVKAYTYENLSSGLFHTLPNCLAAKSDEQIPAIRYIEWVSGMNKLQYSELCKMNHEALKNMYSIEAYMMKFLLLKNIRSETVLNNIELLLCGLKIRKCSIF